MLEPRSRFAAQRTERPRLAPPWLLVPLGLLVIGALLALFPHGDLVRRVLHSPADDLTASYLDNLLRTDPDNPELRLELAARQLAAGHYAQVAATLDRIRRDPRPAIRQRAEWLLWQTEWQQCRALPDDSACQRSRAQLHQRLQQLAAAEWPPADLAALAWYALQLGDPALGQRLFRRLPASVGAHRVAELGELALAEGDYRSSAELYLLAAARAVGPEAERRFFLSGLRQLVAGNRTGEALDLAANYLHEHPALANDPEVLLTLVEYARAAGRPEAADRYVRRLLRLSLLEQFQRQRFALTHFGAFPRPVDSRPRPGDEPGLPFDDRIYSLGYSVFLDNRKPEDAWKVAASAVRQAPDNLVWRERLAQVSEWVGKPQIALDNWRILARRSSSPQAWQAILRLAPGLFDDHALREALQHELASHPGDEKRIRELAAIHERLGEPEAARRFLEQQYAALKSPWLLELLAETSERMGDDLAAIDYWQPFLASGPYPTATALRVALLLALHDRPAAARQVLAGASDLASATPDYWRLRGELARQEGDRSAAGAAYQRLIALATAEENDFSTLHDLWQATHPRQAAAIAAAAWRRFGTTAQLLRALNGYLNTNARVEAGRLLSEIPPTALPALLAEPAFLRLRASWLAQNGRIAAARRDYESALRLVPDDRETASAWFWLLIDNADGPTLRQALEKVEARWSGDPATHDALAAAWLKLSRPTIALRRYLQPHLAEHRGDFLWLMNYADALEQTGETDRAWRLRQYLLHELLPRSPLSSAQQLGLRDAARARLLITHQGGDAGRAALRGLLRLNRTAAGELPQTEQGADLLALAWLQNDGQIAAARGWLWQRFAARTAQVAWAEVGTALAAGDNSKAGELLERYGEILPRHDRINAARLSGDLRRAQSDAFDTLSDQADDNILHQQLSEALLAHSDHAGLSLERQRDSTIDESTRTARWHLALSPALGLDLAHGDIQRRNRDGAQFGTAPDERFSSLGLDWRQHDGSSTRLSSAQRKSFATYHPLLLEHTGRLDPQLAFRFTLGRHLPASDSTLLRLAGHRDIYALGLDFQATRQDTLSGEFAGQRFQTQTGSALGDGERWQFEWRHLLRAATPDLSAGAFWSQNRYQRRSATGDPALTSLLPAGTALPVDTGTLFLPDNFRYYGVRLSSNERYQSSYTRRWQPYFALALTRNSSTGNGYDLSAGIAGSLLGNDHLHLGWSQSRGGPGAGNLTRQIGFDYRLHY